MIQEEIEQGLSGLGLRKGDVVLLHSSLSSLGAVQGGAETVVSAFLSVLGERGTLVAPTFGALGAVTEVVRRHPRAVKSVHPLASVAAIGAQAEAICAGHWKADTAHGENTPYTRIADLGGYVCLLGVDQDRNTTLHTVEALLRLPYLANRTETVTTAAGEETRTWRFFPGPHRDFIGLDRLLRERGVLRIGRIGGAVVRLMKSKALIETCLEAGRANPSFVLCDNPNCADCVAQRAAIRRSRFAKEAFSLVAASGLAGQYVQEMIANLAASGVHRVELDYLQGKPLHMLSSDKVIQAVDELRAAGCEVTALRYHTVPELAGQAFELGVKSGVSRVVFPLSIASEHHIRMAAELRLKLSLSNATLGSIQTSALLMELRETAGNVGFTFNAAHFARAGENPFLYSYKKQLRRSVDQLDVEDCCVDGRPRLLAEGHAEIKEMISILRCASFSGAMVLTTANRPVGDLTQTVARFEALLDAM